MKIGKDLKIQFLNNCFLIQYNLTNLDPILGFLNNLIILFLNLSSEDIKQQYRSHAESRLEALTDEGWGADRKEGKRGSENMFRVYVPGQSNI